MRGATGLRTAVTVVLAGLALTYGSSITAAQMTPQQQRPEQRPGQRPPQPGPRPPGTLPPPPGANICTTQWGWCQLPTITAPLGVGCTCLTADDQEVAGTTRYYPYYGPASPYLQPHTTPPETVR